MKPKLAIVIPYYKKTFFKATLQSLANQTNKYFKIYIGNDASPEDPIDIIENYNEQIDLTYKRFDLNLGGKSLVMQWRRCMEMVEQEKWIAIIGDDDIWEPNFVESFYNELSCVEEKKINVVRFSTIKIDAEGRYISEQYYHPVIEETTSFIFRQTRSSLSEYIFRKSRLLAVGFRDFPLAWASDKLAVIEVSNFEEIYTINNAVARIRISNESITGGAFFKKEKQLAMFLYYYLLLDLYLDKFNDIQIDKLKEHLNRIYLKDKTRVDLFFKIMLLYFKKKFFKDLLIFNITVLRATFNRLR